MKKKFIIVVLIALSINSYSQIEFEKGYFITNSGEKQECLIKSVNWRWRWRYNPTKIDYKTSESGDVKVKTIKDIQEFGVGNSVKYKRVTVDIDRSSEDLKYMTDNRNPSFKKEELFLKVLVEGEASLYEYKDKDLIRYFYSVNNKPIKQLVFKSYRTPDKKAAKNEYYKQQINNDLKCNSISKDELVKLEYEERKLTRIFIKYNQCKNTDFIRYKEKGKKYFFLSAKFSGNVSSLLVQKSVTVLRETEFDNKLGFRLGAELEGVLPFYKNKWRIVLEPTYQQFKSETNAEDESLLRDGQLVCNADYKSIELPIGIRYYMFLKNKSKLFVDAFVIVDFPFNSTIDFVDSADGRSLTLLNVETENNLAFGVGYKYKKYSFELRMQSSREITKRYKYWRSSYNTVSLVFGYNIN